MCPQTWWHTSSHSTYVARGQYAITDGELPMFTTDAIHEFRQIDEAWHNVCGVGLRIPPPPIHNMTLGIMNGNVPHDSSIIKNLKDDLLVKLVAEISAAVSKELASFKNVILSLMQAILKAALTHIQHTTKIDGFPSEIGQQNASSPLLLKWNIVRCYSNLKLNILTRHCIGSLCSQDLCK